MLGQVELGHIPLFFEQRLHMGGNALKNTETRRYERDEYFALVETVLARLRSLPSFRERRMAAIPAYGTKESFGDMDVLVASDGLNQRVWEEIRGEFQPHDFVRNGPVTSFDFESFQIDLILTPGRLFDSHLTYYAFNDLGNLMGRNAYGAGFRYGGAGLEYRVYDERFENTHIGTVELTTDPFEAMKFLGYDPARWKQGFSSKQDIFEYAISSPLTYMDFFDLEKRSYKARVRDAKRATYSEFLQWVSLQDLPASPPDNHKLVQFERACLVFPALRERVEEVKTKYQRALDARDALTVHDIVAWRDTTLVEAGPWFGRFKQQWATPEAYQEWVLTAADDAKKNMVLTSNPPFPSPPLWTLTRVREWSGLSGAKAQEAFTRFPQQWMEAADFQGWLKVTAPEDVKREFLAHLPGLVGNTPHAPKNQSSDFAP